MAIDPFLYLALGVGFLLGRVLPHPGPWVGQATVATILVLVGSLGLLLSSVPVISLLGAIPIALLFCGTILGLTIALEQIWIHRWESPDPVASSPGEAVPRRQFWFPPALVGSLVVGLAVGHTVQVPASGILTGSLYLLLFLVGFDLKVRLASLRRLAIPTVSTVLGALAAAGLLAIGLGVPIQWALASSLAFGWYSLSGPLLAQAAGATAGLLGFLTNFFRENATMIAAPVLGRRLKGEGLTAMGGATSMDTTLFFITRYGDPDAGVLALSSGLLLTLAASFLVPLALTLGR